MSAEDVGDGSPWAGLRPVPGGGLAGDTREFEFDLSAHEGWRRAEVLRAVGADWDPIAVLRDEEEAYELLYAGLDAGQQEVYDRLARAGVLASRGGGRDAA